MDRYGEHNHLERYVQDEGKCPACDAYWAALLAPKPPGPPNPPTHPFHQPIG
jgi:hypothetical protein